MSKPAISSLSKFESFIFDCDGRLFNINSGVLWRSGEIMPKAIELIAKLKRMNKRVAIITNNNSITRVNLCKKMKLKGFNVELNEVFCSSYLAAKYLSSLNIPEGKKVYLVGNTAISDELKNFKISHFGLGIDNYPPELGTHELFLPKDSEQIFSVLVGYDKYISLKKITYAMHYLKNPNVHFIATNSDASFPLSGGELCPGTGSIVAPIETCSNRKPKIIGKPSVQMFELVKADANIDPASCVMVGDRLDTDIKFANDAGIYSILLFSGVTTKDDYNEMVKLNTLTRDLTPDFVFDGIWQVFDNI